MERGPENNLKSGSRGVSTAHFYTIQTSICCMDCLVIANICTYISIYIRNTAISVNKIVCISQHQLVNTCDLHLALYMSIPRGLKQEISLVEDLASTTTTSKHQRFTLNIHSFKLRKRINEISALQRI